MVLKDGAQLRGTGTRLEWTYLILDEAHRLKNHRGQLIKSMKRIATQNRLLLTGTPLQNNLTELFSLMSFTVPKYFKDIDTLREWFNQPFESDAANKGRPEAERGVNWSVGPCCRGQ